MKKKISIMLIIALIIFAFVPALTLAQEGVEDEETTIMEEDYTNIEEYLTALEDNDLLSTVEKITLERKLSSYEENLDLNIITSVVDKVLDEEMDLGQGFVVLNNLEESVENGYEEEKALELINSYQDQENSGQFAFQTALELRKLSRVDTADDNNFAGGFADEIASIIEENGEIETSELKQLAAKYRKEAREENREQMRADSSEKSNSASENALEKGKANNNASENALNKGDNGKESSNSSKAEDRANNKDSNKSSNSKSGEKAKE